MAYFLEFDVNSAIRQGWKPSGAMQVVKTGLFDKEYSQAMIKEDVKDDNYKL